MKILKSDYQKGYVRIQIDKSEDLWHLSHVILPGDLIKSRSLRKIEKGGSDRAKGVVRKPVVLKIRVEKVDFQKGFDSLRVLGKVTEGPEDVPNGSHHSFQLEEGVIIDLEKEGFLSFQIKHLQDAAKDSGDKILICAVDRGEGSFAILKDYGFDFLGTVEGEVEKQDKRVKSSDNFYMEIVKQLEEYDSRNGFYKIIIGSPAFWKDELYKNLKDELKKKIVLVNSNSGGESGIREIIKRDELKKVLKEEKVQEEVNLVEEILMEIGKEGKVCYGFKDILNAVNAGAVDKLIVSDKLIKTFMAENKFKELDEVMRLVEKINGEVHVVSGDHEGGAKLDGLGGIAAILRYNLE